MDGLLISGFCVSLKEKKRTERAWTRKTAQFPKDYELFSEKKIKSVFTRRQDSISQLMIFYILNTCLLGKSIDCKEKSHVDHSRKISLFSSYIAVIVCSS